jgi:hypothetical protein
MSSGGATNAIGNWSYFAGDLSMPVRALKLLGGGI